jgi:hypothetical protein
MKRAIVIFAAAFCAIFFALSIPGDRHLAPSLQRVSTVSLGWIGFYCIYNSLRRRKAAKPN